MCPERPGMSESWPCCCRWWWWWWWWPKSAARQVMMSAVERRHACTGQAVYCTFCVRWRPGACEAAAAVASSRSKQHELSCSAQRQHKRQGEAMCLLCLLLLMLFCSCCHNNWQAGPRQDAAPSVCARCCRCSARCWQLSMTHSSGHMNGMSSCRVLRQQHSKQLHCLCAAGRPGSCTLICGPCAYSGGKRVRRCSGSWI